MDNYGQSENFITEEVILLALNRLGDLLGEHQESITLTCCGGIVSVLYLRSRTMTQDIDAIFPDDESARVLLEDLVNQVGIELELDTDGMTPWLNDSVSFFGLETRSNTVVFEHPNLVLVAATWEEMLAHKILAYRHEKDRQDAVLLLKQITSRDRDHVFTQVLKYVPESPPLVSDANQRKQILRKRFDQIWSHAFEG